MVWSDRQCDPAGIAADHEGRTGGSDVAQYWRGLVEGGVGVGRVAAASVAEQVASELAGETGRGGGGGMREV